MSTTINIDYRVDRPASPSAYGIELFSSNRTPQDLLQVGPVDNNVVRYQGTYLTRAEALRAALDYIGHGCTIIEHRDPMAGSVVHSVQRADYKPREHDVVLASRHRHGDFIHS